MLLLEDLLVQSGWRYKILRSANLVDSNISTVGLGMTALVYRAGDQSASQCMKGHVVVTNMAEFTSVMKELRFLPAVFLLTGTMTEWEHAVPVVFPDCTIILIESDLTVEQLYLQCITHIQRESSELRQLVSHHYLRIAGLLENGARLDEIEEAASQILGNPMIITDESYKVLTYSKNVDVDDFIWKTIVNNEYCPTPIVKMTDHKHFWKRLKSK